MPATAPTGEAAQALQYAFEKLGEIAHQYGPQAVNAAAAVLQVDAVQTLVTGAAAGAVAGGFALAVRWFVPRGLKVREVAKQAAFAEQRRKYGANMPDSECWYYGEAGWLQFACAAVCGGAGVAAVVTSLRCLLDVWAWTALLNPKLALAHEVMQALAARVS